MWVGEKCPMASPAAGKGTLFFLQAVLYLEIDKIID